MGSQGEVQHTSTYTSIYIPMQNIPNFKDGLIMQLVVSNFEIHLKDTEKIKRLHLSHGTS